LQNFDVIIIGSGPSGIGAAYSLSRKGIKNVLVLDEGKTVEEREQIRKTNGLDKKNIACGEGGSGAFSDGKLNFDLGIGWNAPQLSRKDKEEALTLAEEFFTHYGIDCNDGVLDSGTSQFLGKLSNERMSVGASKKLIHIGTDNLPPLVKRIKKDLNGRDIKFLFQTPVVNVEGSGSSFEVITHSDTYRTKNVVFAVGRYGAGWLKRVAGKLGVKNAHGSIDIGVRVEVPASMIENLTSKCYEPKIYITPPKYEDSVRTFCVCPHGSVTLENQKLPAEFNRNDKMITCVNGASDKGRKTSNSNFALLSRVNLTEPASDTRLYGKVMALLADVIGDEKPIIQRWCDFVSGHRSTHKKIEESLTKPTLYKKPSGGKTEYLVTPGDIALAVTHRIATNLKESMFMLEKVFPGIAGTEKNPSKSTLLYFPEPKFYTTKIFVDKHFQTNVPGIYAVGDGAGQTRGLLQAVTTGMMAGNAIQI